MRQIRRNDARDQECHSEEAEAVQDEQRSQRLRALSKAECRPDVACRDDPPCDHAECDAPKECELRQHARLLSLDAVIQCLPRHLVPLGTVRDRVWYYSVPMSRAKE